MLKKLIKRDFKNQKKETFNLRTYPFLIYESYDYKFFHNYLRKLLYLRLLNKFNKNRNYRSII